MALAGVAVASETPITLTTTFTKDIAATISSVDFAVSGVGLTGDTTQNLTSGTFMQEYLRPNTNVDSQNTTWTLTFSLTNNTGSGFVIDTIAINAFSFTGGGAAQNNNRNFLFTVNAGGTTIASEKNLYIVGSAQNNGGNSTGTLTLNLADSLTIASGESMEFSVTVNQGAEVSQANGGGGGRGSFVGMSGMSFSGEIVAPVTPDTPAVPEPATATLSLLALAGLAARRRRK